MTFDCVLGAWREYERELRDFLAGLTGDRTLAEDLLQDVFLKAMKQGAGFCHLDNPRAWLYRVARTTFIDHRRLDKPSVELPLDLPAVTAEERSAVEEMDACLRPNLARLPAEDRAIVEACDLRNVPVRVYAEGAGLTLAAAKSRLLRARQRLRDYLVEHCRVRFDASGAVCCHGPSRGAE